jgi:hypothetical protein
MLTVTYAECHTKAPYAECHFAECRYTECRYAECRFAECHLLSVVKLILQSCM